MILNDEVSANAILKRATKHYTCLLYTSGIQASSAALEAVTNDAVYASIQDKITSHAGSRAKKRSRSMKY